MKWLGFLARKNAAPAPAQATSGQKPAGMDYLRAKAGLAEPVPPPPDDPLPVVPPPVMRASIMRAPVSAPLVSAPGVAAPVVAAPVVAATVIAAPAPKAPTTSAPVAAAAPEPLVQVVVQADALQEKAQQAAERLEWGQAELLWRVMRTGFPHIWSSYRGGAIALFNLGRHDEAAHLLNDGALRFPEERAFPLEQGRQAMERGDWAAAETHWRTALTFDVRPWWVYTELAGALENQGRLDAADAVLMDAQLNADERDDAIALYILPARLAWKRQDWGAALPRWVEARRRFPQEMELPARQHEALMRLAEHDPAAYETALRDLGLAPPDEDKRAMMLRFESLGGTGPDGGCEFGCFQRSHGAEPLGLFRWAAVSPASLIACLNARFAGFGEADAITLAPLDGQWEITDTLYGTKMHSFVSCVDEPHDRMMALAGKRMRFLKDKLIADLRNPAKIFVLKVGWQPVSGQEIEALSHAMRAYGPGELLCVCQSGPGHPEGTIDAAAPSVFLGYLDFFAPPFDVAQRRPVWGSLCQAMLGMTATGRADQAA